MQRLQCIRRLASARALYSSNATTHFGYQEVAEDEKAAKVRQVFDSVATRYDLMNDAMSGGLHRLWKDYFVFRVQPNASTALLDVAGGTGDIALRVRRRMERTAARLPTTTVSDINQAMLDVGKRKASALGLPEDDLSWVCADAEALPFAVGQFNAYTIAFGIRNCTDVGQVLREAFRVLRKGGRFWCLEFSRVENPLLRGVYDWYSFQIIPVMGQILAADWHSYQYLVESIRRFPPQEEFSKLISNAGFRHVACENLSGGVVAIHSGVKL